MSADARNPPAGGGIDRRDFLNGAAVALGALATGASPAQAQAASEAPLAPSVQPSSPSQPGYYPPTRLGLRGSHPGAFELAHAVRDGTLDPGQAIDTDETYDLIVVGGGISGLSAAWFWRDAHPHARILILENHDDFGGHAKRNEFHIAGRTLLMNGGTLEIDSPRPYSPIASGLLQRLGVDPVALSQASEHKDHYLRLGLQPAVFFDRETFGQDRLVCGLKEYGGADYDPVALAGVLADAPLSPQARADIVRIETGEVDYLPQLSVAAKMDRLSRISYRDYLLDVVGADPGVIAYYQTRTHGEYGIGIDAEPALDCWGIGLPGFKGLKLDRTQTRRMGNTAAGYVSTGGSATFHFPDGNASIARLLVRDLIPGALSGATARDIVTAQADYSRLDRAGSPVRLRLNSIVVQARNLDGDASGAEVIYMGDGAQGGQAYRVTARACILAGYNMMIPYIAPDLPEAQKAALHQLVKVPLVYTSVALTNWRSFARLGVSSVAAPGSYFSSFSLNAAETIGGYAAPGSPEEPVLVRMTRTPCRPGAATERDQHRAGRAELLTTPFSTYETHVRDQLGRTLGPGGGFDPDRDIAAITVNRWPHGYAYEYNPLYDPWDRPEAERPHVVGRRRFGAIAIANSDSGGAAYTDAAIDQAHRAVQDLSSV